MTQDEIIEMARQAGFKMENSAAIQAAKAFYKLAIAKERKATIKIIKETPFSNWFKADLVEAIRARGDA
jgi:predicted ABC-type ATPase